MKETLKGRVNLSEKASNSLLVMLQQLRHENTHVEINASKLCSWIIESYAHRYFESDSKQIVEDHFNSKRYLTEILKGAKTNDDIKEALQAASFRLRTKKSPGRPRKPISSLYEASEVLKNEQKNN
jgi:hypothetical protein